MSALSSAFLYEYHTQHNKYQIMECWVVVACKKLEFAWCFQYRW
jgi:hypothetical protein